MKKVVIKRLQESSQNFSQEPTVPWERPSHWKIPVTLGEEVEQAMAEWYGCRGLPLPKEDVGIGARIDAEQRAIFEKEWKEYDEILKKQEDAPAGEKPEFGTPEFWAWARKRKKEKDAERAEQGLPPIPTKKEKEAAKVAKAAEKAEKEAEKAKKAAEKEAKKAAKAK
jgi:hypothetical protein